MTSLSMPPGPGLYLLIGSLPLLVLSEHRSRSHAGIFLFKMLSSVAFASGPLLQASMTNANPNPNENSAYCSLITAGLLFSLVGDFFLLPSRREFVNRDSTTTTTTTTGQAGDVSVSFQLGVVAFAAAHVAYIIAFLRDSHAVQRDVLVGTFVATMLLAKGLGVIYPPSPAPSQTRSSLMSGNILDLAISPDMKPLVTAYALIIGSMFAVAVAAVPAAGAPSSTRWMYQRTVGAAMFVASDLFVAKDAFGREKAPNRRGWFRIAVGYGLYFWGQMVIAGTV